MKHLLLRSIFLIFVVSLANSGFCQVHVTIYVNTPASHKDTIYIAGSFNNWNPSNENFRSLPGGKGYVFKLDLSPGYYEYKLTRGGWGKVETSADGKDIQNRELRISKDTTLNNIVGEWKDDFKTEIVPRKHTASKNVSILDTSFYMPQLQRNRKIWLYLPKDYYTSKKRFPVLYMHDAQNLFDEATSGFGEWGVDECLDSLFNQGIKECIIVGIENGPKRFNEYNPYSLQPYGEGEGNKYVDFIVKTLKPYIDNHLRTLKDKKNTFIAGSSMGGLISLYAVIDYPGTFGGAGIFSPAFWTASGLEKDLKSISKKINSRLYFYAGGKESFKMVPDMKNIESIIKDNSGSAVLESVDPDGKHNEAAWRKYFPQFYKWAIAE